MSYFTRLTLSSLKSWWVPQIAQQEIIKHLLETKELFQQLSVVPEQQQEYDSDIQESLDNLLTSLKRTSPASAGINLYIHLSLGLGSFYARTCVNINSHFLNESLSSLRRHLYYNVSSLLDVYNNDIADGNSTSPVLVVFRSDLEKKDVFECYKFLERVKFVNSSIPLLPFSETDKREILSKLQHVFTAKEEKPLANIINRRFSDIISICDTDDFFNVIQDMFGGEKYSKPDPEVLLEVLDCLAILIKEYFFIYQTFGKTREES